MSQPIARDMLDGLAVGIRDTMIADGLPLAGRCEEAAGLLAERIGQAGHRAEVAWGEYDHPCPDGHPTTGHCWVVTGDLLADPTRAQFDDGPMVMDEGEPAAARYRLHHSIDITDL